MMASNPSNAGQQARSAAGLDSSNPLALVAQILGGMQGFGADSSDPVIAATQRANRGLFPLVQDRRKTNRINERRRAMRVGQGGRTKAQIARDEANRERRRKENAERKAARTQRREDRAIDESMRDLEFYADSNQGLAQLDPNTAPLPPMDPPPTGATPPASDFNAQDYAERHGHYGQGLERSGPGDAPSNPLDSLPPTDPPPGLPTAGDSGNIVRGPFFDQGMIEYLEALRDGRVNQGKPVEQPPAAPSGPLGPGGPSSLRGGPGYDQPAGVIPPGGGPYSTDIPPAPPPRGGGPYSSDLPVPPPSRAYGTSPYEGPTGSPYATGPDPTPYYPPTADRLPPPPAEDFGPPRATGTNDLTPEQAQQMQLDIDRGRMMHRLNEERAREATRAQYDRADQGMNLRERRAAEGVHRQQLLHPNMMERGREFAPPDPPVLIREPYPVPPQPQGPPQRFFHYPAPANPLMALPRTTLGSHDLYSTYGVPFR